MGSAGEDNPFGTYLPEPLAIAAPLRRQHEILFVEAEGGGPAEQAHLRN